MIPVMVTRLVTLPTILVGFFIAGTLGCEPEIGSPCDDNQAKVDELVPRVEGTNNLVQDVTLENCSQGFCLSFQGSRPFCTKFCEADNQCAEAGAGFTCQEVVTFGPLACSNFEDPQAPRPDVESSGNDCSADPNICPEGEVCFSAGDFAGQCGVPGRDCLTGPDGGKSEAQLFYCAADPDVIVARDEQYGRQGL
jgi:hypothetical protein